jgi:hypothetical protein
MNHRPTSCSPVGLSRPLVAGLRRERSPGRADFSPVKTRMLNTVTAIGYSWLASSATRLRTVAR